MPHRIERARALATAALLRERNEHGWWAGELSASALSTATAVTALTLYVRGKPPEGERLAGLMRAGYDWLVRHQNADGGWGDTTRSFSNLSTTTLVWAALGLRDGARESIDADVGRGLPTPPTPGERRTAETRPVEFGRSAAAICHVLRDKLENPLCHVLRDKAPRRQEIAGAIERAERWLTHAAGSLEPRSLVRAIESRYGKDRTFSIPILTMCALCGRLGADGWTHVRQLPFEIAALPQRWFGALQLPVVSYALPALIAIGQVRHGMRPTRNPLLRMLRDRLRERTLAKLVRLQPENGGFLEAAPLTSFVTMSLAALGLTEHAVARRGIDFLVASIRPDGSWPIDTNLATWVTTLSVNALEIAPGSRRPSSGTGFQPVNSAAGSRSHLDESDRSAIRDWLLRQQHRVEHPYTLAARGGWAWTDLPGGVPDADDTPGAMLALHRLAPDDSEVRAAAEAGAIWLLDLQNRDGGIPTFCRGWGKLPFDRSSPDLTAHAIRAWLAWQSKLSAPVQSRMDVALARAGEFLERTQRADGAWVPLWFGHQEGHDDENPVYGTARVILALCESASAGKSSVADSMSFSAHGETLTRSAPGSQSLTRAIAWLVSHQNTDGGWAGARGAASSMEETGVALEALAAALNCDAVCRSLDDRLRSAVDRGATWLAAAVEREQWREPAPIGFYFAKLWYFERLYPLIFATAALNRLAAWR